MNRLESVANRFFEWYDLRELTETGIITFTGRMRRSPFDMLTPGILTRILSSVPDIPALQAFVLTGPKVHDIFKSHRDEIVQSVMEQELGQGLCYARAVYYACEYATNSTDECFEAPQLHFHGPISSKEARALSHYGCTSNRLAVYFSTLYVLQTIRPKDMSDFHPAWTATRIDQQQVRNSHDSSISIFKGLCFGSGLWLILLTNLSGGNLLGLTRLASSVRCREGRLLRSPMYTLCCIGL
jgi:hypothetical protein